MESIKKKLNEVRDWFCAHNHSDYSSLRLRDCINKVEDLIDQGVSLGMRGLALTDHECLSGHIDAIRKTKELRAEGVDFKVALGNEIYLVNSIEEVRDNYQSGITKFPHFILIAKNARGHRAIREMSTVAWGNSYRTGLMERVPIDTASLSQIMSSYKGDIIASTACLGGYIGIKFNEWRATDSPTSLGDINGFIHACIEVFGIEDFYLELQPGATEEQVQYNKLLLAISSATGVKVICTTDTHYLSKEDRPIHKAFLNAKEGEREIDDFYGTTYLMDIEELWGYFKSQMDIDTFVDIIKNTQHLSDKVEFYDLEHEVIVPQVAIPPFNQEHILKNSNLEYISKFANSEHLVDRYMLFEIARGMVEKGFGTPDIEVLERIDVELEQLWLISIKLKQRLSSYYVLTKDVVDLMWELSLVGVARGSVTGFVTTYFMGIIQMNPMKYGLPFWRHISHHRAELPDIDVDSESDKRQDIFTALKEKYGYDRVLNIATFKKEKGKSALQTAGRGLGFNSDEIQALADMIPVERGQQWSLSDCLYGNGDDKEANTQFINAVSEYPNLIETALKIEGLIVGRSIHASGLYIFNNHFIEQNSLMKAPNGTDITCWNMEDSDYAGALKIDCLTIEALDRVRTCLELLLKEGKIEWQGSLRETYNKYIHPDTLEFDSPNMWRLLYEGHITNAFQYETEVGQQALKKIHPHSFNEIVAGNSLMRLSGEGELPLDKYVRFKQDISLWYEEMRGDGLSEEEIAVLEPHLKHLYGVADTQEVVMELSMDSKIGNFDLTEANKLRKGIAKKKQKVIDEVKALFFKKGLEAGTRQVMLDYVWNRQISLSLGLI